MIQPFDFAVTLSSPTVTIPAGRYAVLNVTLTPIGGFNRSVDLSCSPTPTNSQCVLPDTTSLASGPQTVQLVLNTDQIYKFGTRVNTSALHNSPGPGSLPAVALVFSPILALLAKRRKALGGVVALAVCLLGGALLQGCGARQPPTAAPGTYTVTITATDPVTSLKHAASLTMQVTP